MAAEKRFYADSSEVPAAERCRPEAAGSTISLCCMGSPCQVSTVRQAGRRATVEGETARGSSVGARVMQRESGVSRRILFPLAVQTLY